MIGRRAEVAADRDASSAATSSGAAGRSTGATGAVCGVPLPAGLRESDRLPEPIFTPATKAPQGEHDENIAVRATSSSSSGGASAPSGSAAIVARAVPSRGRGVRAGAGSSSPTRSSSSACCPTGEPDPHRRGHDARLVALLGRGRVRARPRPGELRQAVRPRLAASASRGTRPRPGPALPADVVAGTRARYVEAFERITGASFARYLEEDVIAG